MKKLDYSDFSKRIEEVAKARKIFIKSGITKNITIAFELYQAVLAEEQMDVTITKPQVPFEDIERPLCGECDKELQLDPRPRRIDNKLYASTWTCANCGMEYYTEKTAEQWYAELKKD